MTYGWNGLIAYIHQQYVIIYATSRLTTKHSSLFCLSDLVQLTIRSIDLSISLSSPTNEDTFWRIYLSIFVYSVRENECTRQYCAHNVRQREYTHIHATIHAWRRRIYLFDDISSVYCSRKQNRRTDNLHSPFFVELQWVSFWFFRIFFLTNTDDFFSSLWWIFSMTCQSVRKNIVFLSFSDIHRRKIFIAALLSEWPRRGKEKWT